jgi:hypothetical protein
LGSFLVAKELPRNVDIRGTLRALVDHQLSGMLRAKKIKPHEFQIVYERLRSDKNSPEDITEDIKKELLRVLVARNDQPIAASERHGGLGWSHAHIRNHMRRFLSLCLNKMTSSLRGQDSALVGESELSFERTARFVRQRTQALSAVRLELEQPLEEEFDDGIWEENAVDLRHDKPIANIVMCMRQA